MSASYEARFSSWVRPDFDTPTLIEVWRTAPYLHDGRYLTIEELIAELSSEFTIVIVTHSMQQAARVSQRTKALSARATPPASDGIDPTQPWVAMTTGRRAPPTRDRARARPSLDVRSSPSPPS